MRPLCILLLAVGCGISKPQLPTEVPLWIDPSLPAEPVINGCNVWQELTHARCFATVDQGGAYASVHQDGSDNCSDGSPWVGSERRGDSAIFLRFTCFPNAGDPANPDAAALAKVMAHETGHLFLMEHVPQELPALMNAFFDPGTPPILSDADREQWFIVWDRLP